MFVSFSLLNKKKRKMLNRFCVCASILITTINLPTRYSEREGKRESLGLDVILEVELGETPEREFVTKKKERKKRFSKT